MNVVRNGKNIEYKMNVTPFCLNQYEVSLNDTTNDVINNCFANILSIYDRCEIIANIMSI